MPNINVRGSFSPVAGSKVRRVYNDQGVILGTITRLDDGKGYRIYRVSDGKTRIKPLLKDAFKSIRRQN